VLLERLFTNHAQLNLGKFSGEKNDLVNVGGLVALSCPWDSPGKNTGVGCHFFLQGIFLTQGSNPDLLHCRQIPDHLSYKEVHIYILEKVKLSKRIDCFLLCKSLFLFNIKHNSDFIHPPSCCTVNEFAAMFATVY
jgi:hypothetical protein